MNNTPFKKLFKVIIGFKPTKFVIVDENEVEKAYAAFILETKCILAGRTVHKVFDVEPHYNASLGFSDEYEFGSHPDDWRDARRAGIVRPFQELQSSVQSRVSFLLDNNRKAELGTGVTIPQLGMPAGKRIAGLDELANGMRV